MTTRILPADIEGLNVDADDECPGAGLCHGCLKWCANCGDVDHVCDARLRGERCDAHPVPPDWPGLRKDRREAELKLRRGQAMVHEAQRDLEEVGEAERARRAYDEQMEKA